MTPLARDPAMRVAIAVVAIVSFALGFVPLFGGPRYESALAAGLLVPATAAIATALELSKTSGSPAACLGRGLANAMVLFAVSLGVALAHGVRVGYCDPVAGLVHWALAPLPGALLGGAWGAWIAERARTYPKRWRRRLRAVGLGLAAPLACVAVSVARFVTSPMIFAYDPFFGFFSGSIYDTVVSVDALATYRLGTLATLVACVAIAGELARGPGGRLVVRPGARRGALLVGAVAACASLAVTASGPRLGHWQTRDTIVERLGGRLDGARCALVYAREIPLDEARRFVEECDAHVEDVERYFETRGPAHVTAFLFASAGQKGALMGAEGTYIAKPWREEIYVQASGFPHPVLGHELAHVIAGAFGHGPFKVAGSAWGILADPGLIEGAAVAASPREGDLSPSEWAKAMRDLGLLPKLPRLFGLSFFGTNSSAGYTAAGAFIQFVRETHGAAALRRWYAGESVAAATGKPLAQLEAEWHAALDRIELGDAARAQAKARFDRPALFSRKCPREVDACRERAEVAARAGDHAGAAAALEQARALDPVDPTLRREAVAHRLRGAKPGSDDERAAALELAALAADEKLPVSVRDKAEEELADRALVAGEGELAQAGFARILARTVDEDRARTLEVKMLAARDPLAREGVSALLVGLRGRAPDKVLAVSLITRWVEAAPADGVPRYLLGRQHAGSGDHVAAAAELDAALAPGRVITIPRVEAEALRLRVECACALGDRAAVKTALARYEATTVSSAARKAGVRAFAERCTRAR